MIYVVHGLRDFMLWCWYCSLTVDSQQTFHVGPWDPLCPQNTGEGKMLIDLRLRVTWEWWAANCSSDSIVFK